MSFSTTFFDYGVVLLLITLCQELLNLLLCRIWKIKVEEFSIFFKFKTPLFRKEIGGVTYLLGWIPYGSYIKPAGSSQEDLERIHVGELPFTFLGASKSKRFVFYCMPYLLWILVLTGCCFFIAPGKGFGEGIQVIGKFMSTVVERYTGSIPREEFVQALRELIAGKSPVLFLLGYTMVLSITLTPLSNLSNWCVQDKQKWPLKTFGYLLMLAMLYFYVFKLFAIFFSVTGYALGFGCLLSFSAGAYLIGTVGFFLIVLVARLKQR